MQLVWGRVSSPSGVAGTVEKRFTFQVRAPFVAEFSCERENAQAACLPIRPMTLSFNAPVPRKLAAAIRLKSPLESIKPQMGGEDEGPAAEGLVSSVRFAAPLAESTAFQLELPKGLKDAAGRALSNADSFPLRVATGGMPPLAKFAAAPFGVVERLAEGPQTPALLPVTLRKVEAALRVQGLQPGVKRRLWAKVSTLRPENDADIIAWFRKVQQYNNYMVERKQARRDVKALPQVLDDDKHYVQSRMVSLLSASRACVRWTCPRRSGYRPAPVRGGGYSRWRRVSMWWRLRRPCWVPRCSMRATAQRAPWLCVPRRWSPTWGAFQSWAARTPWPG